MLPSEYAAIHVPHVRRFIATCSCFMPSDALSYEINPTILTVQRVCTQFFHNYFTLGSLHDKEMYVLTVIALCIIYNILTVKGCPPPRYIFSCLLSDLLYYNQNGRNMQHVANDTYRSKNCVRSENKYRHNGMTISKKVFLFADHMFKFCFAILLVHTLKTATVLQPRVR
jgi:hypothetical protein